jgi:hypothetical protein
MIRLRPLLAAPNGKDSKNVLTILVGRLETRSPLHEYLVSDSSHLVKAWHRFSLRSQGKGLCHPHSLRKAERTKNDDTFLLTQLVQDSHI